jgi:hypothetical protein
MMPSKTKKSAPSVDLNAQVMGFMAKVKSIDKRTCSIDIVTRETELTTSEIEISTRRIEQLLLHLCDAIKPGHPEIAKIKKEIEQPW